MQGATTDDEPMGRNPGTSEAANLTALKVRGCDLAPRFADLIEASGHVPCFKAVHMDAPSTRVKSIEKLLAPRAVPHMLRLHSPSRRTGVSRRPMAPRNDGSMLARRGFLKAMGATIIVASGLDAAAGQAQTVPWSAGTEPPKLKAPPNACDCHMHIYNNRFPVAPNAKLRPPDATVDAYRLFQKRIGTTRNVVVTPSTYGTDNSCTLDAMGKLGATARGVAVVDTSVTNAELKRLNGLGIRGIRFNLVQSGATTIDMLEPLSKRVNDLGWHAQIHMLGKQIVEAADLLQRLPSPIVFDHMARIPEPAGVNDPAFALVMRWLDGGRTW